MKIQTKSIGGRFRVVAQWLVAGVVILASAAGGLAAEPSAKELEAAVSGGSLAAYFDSLTAWLNQKTPAQAAGVSDASLAALLKDPAFASALAQRQFIAKLGVANLEAFARGGPQNKEFLSRLLADTEAMGLCLEGATPLSPGRREQDHWTIPIGALETWNKIRQADPDAASGIYQRLAIATALAPPGSGNRGAGMAKTPGDPVDRYKHFKAAHKNGEMFPSFDRLAVWECQRIVSSCASDADLGWARQMLNTWRPDLRVKQQVVRSTSEVCYRKPLFPFTDYPSVLAAGGKCGPRSSWAVMICQAFGIPSVGVGQPAHACVAYRTMDGSWKVAYGGGWEVSRLEDMRGPEFVEAVAARAHAAEFSKVERLRWLASALTSKDAAAAVMTVAHKISKISQTAAAEKPKASGPELEAEGNAEGKAQAARAAAKPADASLADSSGAAKAEPGVLHIEAAAFANSYAEPAHPDEQKGVVFVYDCYTGGKQVNFQRNMTTSWVDYAIDAPAAGTYSLTLRVAAANLDQVFDVSVGGQKQATIKLPYTRGLWGTSEPVDVKLAQGKQTLRVAAPMQRGVAMRWLELKGKP